MNIRLEKLKLRNFKGVKTFTLDVDGAGLVLTKTMVEKWTKKRGSSAPNFDGHVTSYEVDGIPKKKGEYTNIVDKTVGEDVFRLLTSITHFNALKWQDRRRLLLEVSGSLTDKEVLDRIGLDRAKELLDGRSYEDAVAVLKSQRSKVSKALDGIQPRLDEVDRSSSTDAPESPKTNLSLAELQEALKAAQNERAAARRVELEAEQQRLGQELDGIDADLMTLEDFLRAKVGMIEGLVADKFAPLGFKLFEDQINGGLRETCETLVPSPEGNLVPWQDANTGHRILAGLRIT